MFLPFFPLHRPISFLPQGKLARLGKSVEADTVAGAGYGQYSRVQEPLWEKMAEERLRVAEAKKKFKELDMKELKRKWSKWDEATIDGYRLQFRVMDLNDDGLIDFHEFCKALDDLKDASSNDERRMSFEEVDADHSDGVDFEEFLELIDRVQEGRMGGIGQVYTSEHSEIQNIMHIGRLSLSQQIKYRLF